MAKKEDTLTPSPGDVGHSFEREDIVLNYKPTIEYEEPPQEDVGQAPIEENREIEEARNRTQQLIDNYKKINDLTDIAQRRIDNRVQAGGGLEIQLDPQRDAHVISALKRCFPEAKAHNKITYEMYKQCLARMNKSPGSVPQVRATDVQAAKEDPLRTDFGGFNAPPGLNRPEIASPAAGSIQPIDLSAFQAAGVLALFQLLYPYIKKEDKLEILEHLATAPHKPI